MLHTYTVVGAQVFNINGYLLAKGIGTSKFIAFDLDDGVASTLHLH